MFFIALFGTYLSIFICSSRQTDGVVIHSEVPGSFFSDSFSISAPSPLGLSSEKRPSGSESTSNPKDPPTVKKGRFFHTVEDNPTGNLETKEVDGPELEEYEANITKVGPEAKEYEANITENKVIDSQGVLLGRNVFSAFSVGNRGIAPYLRPRRGWISRGGILTALF